MTRKTGPMEKKKALFFDAGQGRIRRKAIIPSGGDPLEGKKALGNPKPGHANRRQGRRVFSYPFWKATEKKRSHGEGARKARPEWVWLSKTLL